jgi:ADP-heptose:LPS heptosyltransferase
MRILIVKPSALGDIIHGMVVVSELKAQLPDCVIDWVVGDAFCDIIRQSGIAQKVFVYERHGGLSGLVRLGLEIRKEPVYDYVFDMQGLARSGIVTLIAKSINKIGRKDSRELSMLAYSQTISYPGPAHAIDILKEFLTIVGCNNEVSGLVPELGNVHSSEFESFLASEVGSNRIICLFPESQRPEKEWHLFSCIVPELLKNTTNTLIFVLGKRKDRFFDGVSPRFFDLRSMTSLADIVFLIKNSALVIANDSGPLHISAALGRQTFGLFTETDPFFFGPYPLSKASNMALQLNNSDEEIGIVVNTALEMLENTQ